MKIQIVRVASLDTLDTLLRMFPSNSQTDEHIHSRVTMFAQYIKQGFALEGFDSQVRNIIAHLDLNTISPNALALMYIASACATNVIIVVDDIDDVQKFEYLMLAEALLAYLGSRIAHNVESMHSLLKSEVKNAVKWHDSMKGDIEAIGRNAVDIMNEVEDELKKALGA